METTKSHYLIFTDIETLTIFEINKEEPRQQSLIREVDVYTKTKKEGKDMILFLSEEINKMLTTEPMSKWSLVSPPQANARILTNIDDQALPQLVENCLYNPKEFELNEIQDHFLKKVA